MLNTVDLAYQMRRAESAVRTILEGPSVGERMIEIVRLYDDADPDERYAIMSVLATRVAIAARSSALVRPGRKQ